ncbi:hypothetical protein FEM48_Zijuj02G0132100 [Ziziphus jujuba var. spinosa]|uniref:F-box domain-containing protein n=1 Tax=Ziziphus jujuba var. spinosa TaxID=714518 RepID=A0A978VVX5_ZIZJJ|nr:hypothetical protein FEM48_Zijuj02G0132100 [Ziziphus jujuba var. spinosa]
MALKMESKKAMIMNLNEANLNEGMLIEIPVRLPVISLLRFKCVCKSWCSLISSPFFIANHLQLCNCTTNNPNLLVKNPTRIENNDIHCFSWNTANVYEVRDTFSYEFWVLREVGLVESWTKLYTIGLLDWLDTPTLRIWNENMVIFDFKTESKAKGRDNILSEELEIEILARLPVISLLRFKCVCKSWRSIITRRFFIQKHLQVCNSTNPPDLLVQILSPYDFNLESASILRYDNPLDVKLIQAPPASPGWSASKKEVVQDEEDDGTWGWNFGGDEIMSFDISNEMIIRTPFPENLHLDALFSWIFSSSARFSYGGQSNILLVAVSGAFAVLSYDL